MKSLILILLTFLLYFEAHAQPPQSAPLRTNEALIHNAPKWLKRVRVERLTERVQRRLEWTTRQVDVYFHSNRESYNKAHSLGDQAAAVTVSSAKKQTVHLGPKVNDGNFDQIFAHELVHVIIAQKYRGSIPKWLEEGLANHIAQSTPVNYKWLSQQSLPQDVTKVAHPFQGRPEEVSLHYRISQALIEMLDKKCNLENLIRLSVQRDMNDYIRTYCEISDISSSFQKWVQAQATTKK